MGIRFWWEDRKRIVWGNSVDLGGGSIIQNDAIMEMTTKRLGCTCVVRDDGTLEGIITDGDLRRLLHKTRDISAVPAAAAMTRTPKIIRPGTLAVAVLEEMEQYNITQMIVVDE